MLVSLEKVAKRVPKSLRDYAVDTCFRGLRFKKSVLPIFLPLSQRVKMNILTIGSQNLMLQNIIDFKDFFFLPAYRVNFPPKSPPNLLVLAIDLKENKQASLRPLSGSVVLRAQ